jgi:hypothetical protein
VFNRVVRTEIDCCISGSLFAECVSFKLYGFSYYYYVQVIYVCVVFMCGVKLQLRVSTDNKL